MAGLTSTEKHAIWQRWNEEISRQKISTGADKWDVLVSIWALDEDLEALQPAEETLDGKDVSEAKASGDAMLSGRKSELTQKLPRSSRAQIGDEALGLLVGLVAQQRDVAFRPLPPPEVEEPVDVPGDEPGDETKGK